MAEIILVDCYGPLSLAQMKVLKTTGVHGIAGYLGRKTMGYSKAMTPQSVKDALSLGFVMISVWEGNSTRTSYFTKQQGVLDATRAIEDAEWLGQPRGSAIYFAVDYDCQNRDMPAIRNYFEGVKSVLNGKYKVGIYGGGRALNNVSVDYYWQTVAWSGGVNSPRMNMKQTQVDIKRCGIGVDIDVIHKESGQWPTSKPVAPIESNYPSVKIQLNGNNFTDGIVVDGGTYVMWSGLLKFNTPHNYKGQGVMEVEGKDIKGVVYKGNTYLLWSSLAKGIKATKITDGWNFYVETAPIQTQTPTKPINSVPAPASAPKPLPPAIILKGKYPIVKVQLNGKNFNSGIVYNGATYVMWKALDEFKTPHTYKGNGIMNIGGKDVQGIIYGPNTYLPWGSLAQGIKAGHINGGWNFVAPIN